jgi:hypothetical protein
MKTFMLALAAVSGAVILADPAAAERCPNCSTGGR